MFVLTMIAACEAKKAFKAPEDLRIYKSEEISSLFQGFLVLRRGDAFFFFESGIER